MGHAPGRLLALLTATALLTLGGAPAAWAHEERESVFPPGTGTTPSYRPFDEARPRVVVCKPESAAAIAALTDPALRKLNQRLLGECRFADIQAGVDAVTTRGTNLYVLPGTYREQPSVDAPCAQDYDGGIVDYPLILSCGEVINLVTIAGDSTPDTDEVDCNQLCDLQIEGTGQRMEDVVLQGGFTSEGDWRRHNGMKADRAYGFYVRNMTFELARENGLYVHEVDGYGIDRVNARDNDLYGILTFTSDHGVVRDCDASYNGDSGIYPGSAADVNQDNPATGPLSRFAVEIFGCRSHHNALGFSGTAGNSVYFHDNDVFANGAGYVTDSFVGGHPGMPQDHAWLENNTIHGNNNNYYKQFVHTGTCSGPPASRGYGKGTVCPAFPVPVGTGVLMAGGNRNFVHANQIYDNWRAGAMLFYVPGAIRGEFMPQAQLDTSNGNHYTANRLGRHPSGVLQPNGVDFSWDEQGVGNCWQGNIPASGAVTDDTAVVGLPDCDSGGSVSPVGNVTVSARNAPCATYNREDNNDPSGCDWFDSPPMPAGRQAAADETEAAPAGSDDASADAGTGGTAPPATAGGNRPLPATGASMLPAVLGLALAAAAYLVRRRRLASNP